MIKVVLFGGGDGGGLIIGPDGVKPIPPFEPTLRFQLQAVARLVSAASRAVPGPNRDRLSRLTTELAAEAIGTVEQKVGGELDGEAGLIYTDDGGGFICGSTGQPPTPLPWPPAAVPAVERLVQLGLLNAEAVDVLRSAADRRADVLALLREPEAEAERIGLRMSSEAAAQIRRLGLGDPSTIEDPVDREIVEFFHRSLEQGDLIDRWAADPLGVAAELGVPLSNDAARRIVSANIATTLSGPSQKMSPYAVAVVVVVVIVVWEREAKVAVIDRSGLEKF